MHKLQLIPYVYRHSVLFRIVGGSGMIVGLFFFLLIDCKFVSPFDRRVTWPIPLIQSITRRFPGIFWSPHAPYTPLYNFQSVFLLRFGGFFHTPSLAKTPSHTCQDPLGWVWFNLHTYLSDDKQTWDSLGFRIKFIPHDVICKGAAVIHIPRSRTR